LNGDLIAIPENWQGKPAGLGGLGQFCTRNGSEAHSLSSGGSSFRQDAIDMLGQSHGDADETGRDGIR
jgi:hypothetical protein